MATGKLTVGIVGGLLPEAAMELKTRILHGAEAAGRTVSVLIDWEPPLKDAPDEEFALRDKKILTLDAALRLEKEGADLILVPGVMLHKDLPEIQTELQTPVFDWFAAIGQAIKARGAKRVLIMKGVLGECSLLAHAKLFGASGSEPLMPEIPAMEKTDRAIEIIRAEGVTEEALGLLKDAAAGEADAVLPMNEAVALAAPALCEAGVPCIDTLGVMAEGVLGFEPAKLPKPFKLGLIGGLGPAATVDLFDKIVKATPAKNDQEHFKLVIDENPQIPDRTGCLLEGKTDPTLALYHVAKRLQDQGCDAIIIPCNTAHSFLPSLTRHLGIPFVDMQMTVLQNIAARFKEPRIGLLATSGTIKTGIYAKKAAAMGIPLFVPDDEHERLVMSAIYGPKGAKAGFTDGVCREELLSAADYLVREHGCNILILGCTELPLILNEADEFPVADTRVAVVDPTAELARRVAKMATEENARRGTR